MTLSLHDTSSRISPEEELAGIMADLSQFLSEQKKLGSHGSISLSEQSLQMMASWGQAVPRNAGPDPEAAEAEALPFRCQGPPSASVVLMDSLGTFYGGKGGQLLVKMLSAIHLSPDDVYICTPVPADFLGSKIQAVHVKMMFAFGERAARMVTGSNAPLAQIQGKPVRFCGIPAMPTYHPEDLLKDPALKRPVWEAMKQMVGRAG